MISFRAKHAKEITAWSSAMKYSERMANGDGEYGLDPEEIRKEY